MLMAAHSLCSLGRAPAALHASGSPPEKLLLIRLLQHGGNEVWDTSDADGAAAWQSVGITGETTSSWHTLRQKLTCFLSLAGLSSPMCSEWSLQAAMCGRKRVRMVQTSSAAAVGGKHYAPQQLPQPTCEGGVADVTAASDGGLG